MSKADVNAKAHNVLGLNSSQPTSPPSDDGDISPLEVHETYLESRSPTIESAFSPASRERVRKQCRFGPSTTSQESEGTPNESQEQTDSSETLTEDEKGPPARCDGVPRALHLSRAATNISIAPRDEAPTAHKYIFRRPRALQAKYMGQIHAGGDSGINSTTDIEQLPSHPSISSGPSDEADNERRSTDFVEAQRDRIELFIDLLFIGIISNLSEHFFERVFGSDETLLGSAIGEFILLFLPTWRIWSALQQFLSAYYLDDAFQRTFVLIVLALSLVWGNNAPYFLGAFNTQVEAEQSHFAISTYLIAIFSIHLMEVFYSIWIPFIRRILLVLAIVTLPSLALWISVVVTEGDTQVYLMTAALVAEWAVLIIVSSPIGDRLQGGSSKLQRSLDANHTRKRFETFFLIALGEGVFLLIRASPLGEGWSQSIGAGVLALILYFLVHYLYFNGDHTRVFIHALHRRWYFSKLWYMLHLVMYGALVLMSSAVLYLVEYVHQTDLPTTPETATEAGAETHYPPPTSHPQPRLLHRAEQSAEQEAAPRISMQNVHLAEAVTCITLAISLLCMFLISLLNRPLDEPKTLVCNNRFVRLLPRFLSIVVFATMWLKEFSDPITLLGSIVGILFFVYIWEQHTGLETGWSFFEPSIIFCEGCERELSMKSSRHICKTWRHKH